MLQAYPNHKNILWTTARSCEDLPAEITVYAAMTVSEPTELTTVQRKATSSLAHTAGTVMVSELIVSSTLFLSQM